MNINKCFLLKSNNQYYVSALVNTPWSISDELIISQLILEQIKVTSKTQIPISVSKGIRLRLRLQWDYLPHIIATNTAIWRRWKKWIPNYLNLSIIGFTHNTNLVSNVRIDALAPLTGALLATKYDILDYHATSD